MAFFLRDATSKVASHLRHVRHIIGTKKRLRKKESCGVECFRFLVAF